MTIANLLSKNQAAKLALLALALIPLAALAIYLLSHASNQSSTISTDDQLLLAQTARSEARVDSDTQPRLLNKQDHNTLSENLAQVILRELDQFPKTGAELKQALLKCTAEFQYNLHPERKTCADNYMAEPDFACMQKRGWGRNDLRQILYAEKVELNKDGHDDYIVSSRYGCLELNANNSNVHFVLLSNDKKQYHLAYADWAVDHLEARVHPVNHQVVLMEVIEKLYGKYTRFYQIDTPSGRFQERICLVEDKDGVNLCPPPQAQ